MAIITSHNNLAINSSMVKRDDKNVRIEPVTVDVIQDEKPLGIVAITVLLVVLTGFTAWTLDMVSPSPSYNNTEQVR